MKAGTRGLHTHRGQQLPGGLPWLLSPPVPFRRFLSPHRPPPVIIGSCWSHCQSSPPTLTFFSSLGICGWLKSLSRMMPSTRRASSILPPTLPSTCEGG